MTAVRVSISPRKPFKPGLDLASLGHGVGVYPRSQAQGGALARGGGHSEGQAVRQCQSGAEGDGGPVGELKGPESRESNQSSAKGKMCVCV